MFSSFSAVFYFEKQKTKEIKEKFDVKREQKKTQHNMN